MLAHVTADAAAEQLTRAERRWLPLLQKVNLADADELLSIVTDPAFQPSDVRWTSMRAADAFLDDMDDTVRTSTYLLLSHPCTHVPLARAWVKHADEICELACTGVGESGETPFQRERRAHPHLHACQAGHLRSTTNADVLKEG